MQQSYTVYSDSIVNLLESLTECPNSEILLPVVESLLEELTRFSVDREERYRKLLALLSNHVTEQNYVSDKSKKLLEWLDKLTRSPVDITALESLVKSLRVDDTAPTAPPETIAATLPKEAHREVEQAASSQADEVNRPPISIDFHKLAQLPEDNEEAIAQVSDEQRHQGDEINRLKTALQQRLSSTKNQCQEFESLMQLLLADLREARNATEMETIRAMLQRAIKRLLSEHETISSNIVDVANELNRFGNQCEQLNHELGLVKRLSLTDELTRLPNRRAFLKRLKNESGRVQRYGYPLSVALIDLDLFKEVNDTYGHAVGDEVLQTYTEKVLSTFRNYDLVARYGGEEFAVLLPHTDLSGAERALNKVLQKTASTVLPASQHNKEFRIPTFSAGVAIYHEGEPIESVINRADKAMYTAKKLGRNRVIVQAES